MRAAQAQATPRQGNAETASFAVGMPWWIWVMT